MCRQVFAKTCRKMQERFRHAPWLNVVQIPILLVRLAINDGPEQRPVPYKANSKKKTNRTIYKMPNEMMF